MTKLSAIPAPAVAGCGAGIDMQGYTFHAPSESGFYGEDRYSFTKGSPVEVVTDPQPPAGRADRFLHRPL